MVLSTLLAGCTEVPEEDHSPKPRRSNDGCREVVFVPSDDIVAAGVDGIKPGVLIGDGSKIIGFRLQVHYDGLYTMSSPTTDPGVGYELILAPNDLDVAKRRAPSARLWLCVSSRRPLPLAQHWRQYPLAA